jgi:hypothetical protein
MVHFVARALSPAKVGLAHFRRDFAVALEVGANVRRIEADSLTNANWNELTTPNQRVDGWPRDSEELRDLID